MHVAVVCFGTRGDVEPYVALAQGLSRSGFQVTLGAGDEFADFVSAHQLPFWRLGTEMRTLVESAEGRSALAGSPEAALALLKPRVERAAASAKRLIENADAVIYHPVLTFVDAYAERFGIPSIRAVASQPVMVQGPAVYGYSPRLLPRSSQWPDDVQMTGYWLLKDAADWEPPRDLVRFLTAQNDQNRPVVYVGFGSMSVIDPTQMTTLVVQALERAECRGVLASGWGGLSDAPLPEHVLLVRDAPHEWLFPRVSAVVHHGGAGTTASGLRAGKPTVICPFGLDQPFWGEIVQKLGVGPKPLPQHSLTALSLGAAIRETIRRVDFSERAKELGRELRNEDGVGNAVSFIRAHLGMS